MISTPLPDGYPEKDELLSDDLSQFNQQSTEYFNELPYCELVKAKIIEIDQSLNRKPGKIIKPSHEKEILLECTCVAKGEARPKKRGKRRKKKDLCSMMESLFLWRFLKKKEKWLKLKRNVYIVNRKNKRR